MVSVENILIIAFILILLLIVYFKRKHMEIQKIIFPFLYVILWRGQLGVKWMDRVALKFCVHPCAGVLVYNSRNS